jgi:hypothetical protein
MKKFLIVLLVLIVALGVIGMVLPKNYQLKRSVTISAAPPAVHTFVGDLKKWPDWAPWQDEDPTIKVTYGPKTSGVGASQTWTGKSGDGRLTFTKCDDQGVAWDMVFVENGREMPAKGWMTYQPVTGATVVEWGMEGKIDTPVIGGYLTLFMPMMVGGMFDKGLSRLKSKVEAKGG